MSMVPVTTQWKPPQRKWVHGAIIGGLVIAGAIAIKTVAPTLSDAMVLLGDLFRDTTQTMIYGGVLLAVFIFLKETFTPDGALYKLIGHYYSSAVNRATWAIWQIDPMTPLWDRLRQVQSSQASFDDAFAQFDGMINNLKQREAVFRKDAADSERKAKYLWKQISEYAGDKESEEYSTMKSNFEIYGHQTKAANDTANEIAANRARLEPVRRNLKDLRSVVVTTIAKMKIDITNAKERWDTQKTMSTADKAARGVLGQSASDYANEAMAIIDREYATQIGRLENLKDITSNLISDVNIDKGSSSEELIAKWEAEARPVLQIAAPTQQPMAFVGAASPQPSTIGSFIR